MGEFSYRGRTGLGYFSALVIVFGVLVLMVTEAVPAEAAGYKVKTKGGRTLGRVLPGPVPSGAGKIGVVRDRTKFRGAVYSRQSNSGHVGWPVSNGQSYVAWVKKVSAARFLVKKLPWASAAGRVTRISSGAWLAQKKAGGGWVTVGRVQKGCRGQWAAGATRLLLWAR
jgi:hypothetical protein